jgi:hypothetical protein
MHSATKSNRTPNHCSECGRATSLDNSSVLAARIAEFCRWYGWMIVKRQNKFFFDFFIEWRQLKAAGGEARVEGDVSYPAVGMLIFASCPAVVSQTGSAFF